MKGSYKLAQNAQYWRKIPKVKSSIEMHHCQRICRKANKVVMITPVLQPKLLEKQVNPRHLQTFCSWSLREFWFVWVSWQKFVLFWGCHVQNTQKCTFGTIVLCDFNYQHLPDRYVYLFQFTAAQRIYIWAVNIYALWTEIALLPLWSLFLWCIFRK